MISILINPFTPQSSKPISLFATLQTDTNQLEDMTAMKETGLVQKNRRKKIKKRLILIALITIIPTFFIGFFVGQSYAADEKNVTQEGSKKTESSIKPEQEEKVEKAPLAHSNSDATQEIEQEEPASPDKEQTNKQEKPAVEPIGKVVYLTFDDGPSKLTDQFLDVLRAQDVKATFFMQGSNLNKEHLQESVKRATTEGHYIGAHSMTHDYKKLYSDNQFVPEMKETLALIREITGTTPNLVRPPYGSAPGLNGEQIRNQIVASGIKIWDWTIDSNDWALKNNPAQIIENIKNGTTTDREIVLMHEHPQTLAALPKIIAFYKEQGYKFVVYDEANHFDLNFQKDKRL